MGIEFTELAGIRMGLFFNFFFNEGDGALIVIMYKFFLLFFVRERVIFIVFH